MGAMVGIVDSETVRPAFPPVGVSGNGSRVRSTVLVGSCVTGYLHSGWDWLVL
ncbi:hypothetical protein I545_5555 [Mycobacterium kansasii 662]|uniref:Uncharacterized protein n=1 Tax=Mycobacterium kansasii 662 TaxID=1299326 RepID=X7YUY2_MYCKA|nr:hypothetical protein I545_5555 [Mycobacterium kansasii 662]